MAKIKGTEFFDISDAIAQAREYQVVSKENLVILKETATELKKFVEGLGTKSAKDFRELNSVVKSSKENFKSFNQEQKASLQIKKQLEQATDLQVKGQLRLQKARSDQKKILKEEIELENKQIGTLKKLSIESNKLRRERDALNLETQEGVTRLKQINDQLDRNNEKLRSSSDKFKQGKLSVGQYTEGIKKAGVGLKNLASALGVVGGIQLLARVMRDAFNTVRDFEQSIANLSAITGATGKDLEFLKQTAIDLGSATTLSASQVAEGFKLIASAKPELLEDAEALAEVTRQSITLAEAAGITLPEAAAAVTSSLNQFGEGAEKTAEFVDILAAGAKFGSGDINFLNEALIKVGVVASSAGVSFRETTAALEVLAKAGIPASTAGNNLKNVILSLEEAGLGFTSGQFNFNEALEESRQLLDSIKDPAERAAKEIDLFKKENLAAGQTLLGNAALLDDLNEKLGQQGIAAEQAAINNDTLGGAVKLLKSAWEGFILGADGAGGASNKLKDIIKFLAENLDTILKSIILVVKVWGAYKLATIASATATKLMNSILPSTTRNLNKTAKATDNLNKKARLNPFGLWVAALTLLVPILIKVVGNMFSAVKHTTALQRATAKVNNELIREQAGLQAVFETLKKSNPESQRRADLIDAINSKYGLTLQNLEDEEAFIAQVTAAYEELNKQLEIRIKRQIFEEELADLFRQEREFTQAIEQALTGKQIRDEDLRELFEFTGSTKAFQAAIEQIRIERKELFDEINALEDVPLDFAGGEDGGDGDGDGDGDGPKAEDTRNKQIQDLRKQHLLELIKIENEGIKAGDPIEFIRQAQFERRRMQIIEEFELTKKLFKEGSKETISAQIKLNNELLKLQQKFNIERIDIRRKANDIIDLDDAELLKASEKRRQDQLKKEREQQKERIKQIQEISKNIQDAVTSQLKMWDDLIQKREEAIDQQIDLRKDEVTTHEDRITDLKQLAAEGNLSAKESIKAERAKIDKLEADIKELEDKKRFLQALSLALTVALNLAEAGDPNAISKGFSQTNDAVGGFPTFKEGAEDTGKGGNVDSDGGFGAILHPHERVLPEEMNKGLLDRGLSNPEVAAYAMRFHDDLMNNDAPDTTFGDLRMLAMLNGISEGQEQGFNDVVSAVKGKLVYMGETVDSKRNAFITFLKSDKELQRIIRHF